MVGGSLMQLVAYGAQDIYLTGNFGFRIYYKKHIINEIVEQIEIVGWKLISFFRPGSTKYEINGMFKFRHLNKYNAINCSNLKIAKLPGFYDLEYFSKLKYFICSHNQLKNIDKLKYINLIMLDCSYNQIVEIPNKMNLLEYFDFSDNFVSGKLNFENYPNIKYLLASSNQIEFVSNISNDLIYLDLSNNPIKSLDNLPNNLEYLLLVQTRITTINLITLTKLKYLDISINFLNDMNGLPNNLIYLNCSQCNLLNLNNLPTSIQNLMCINNRLEQLDFLPDSIEHLNCDHNNITNLDNLPSNLKELICSNNKLSQLDNLPNGLKFLEYSKKEISSIKNLPKDIEIMIK